MTRLTTTNATTTTTDVKGITHDRDRATKRILALHGKGSSARAFERALERVALETSSAYAWTFAEGAFASDRGWAWWELRENERSHSARELPGVEHSIEAIKNLGPFECVFGFSQGAMLAALLCCEDERAVTEKCIIVGAGFPSSQRSKFERMRAKGGAGVKSLHVIGAFDDINPPEQARDVARAFGAGAEIFEFQGGHTVPMDARAVQKYVDFLMSE